jgi:predicted permease
MTDLRYALKSLRRAPAFVAIAIVTLGTGIGANTTMFSLANAIHLKPLGLLDADRLVVLEEASATRLCAGCAVGTSYAGFRDWERLARSYFAIAAYNELPFALSGDGDPERVSGAAVSANLFEVLGVQPVVGRSFSVEEDRPGAERVLLVSYGLWQRRYGSDPGIVGRTVILNGIPHTTIGVAPPGFNWPETAELWVPLSAHVPSTSDRADRDIGVVGRLAPGVTVSQADAELKTIARSLEAQYPETQREWSARVQGLREAVAGETGGAFLILLGAGGFVLLIVCANVAALFLSRAAARRRHIAVRAALGASRGRLVRQLVAESLVVGLAGGALGLLLAFWGLDAAERLIPVPIPYWIEFTIDARVLAFCVAASVVSGVLVGALPGVSLSNPNLAQELKEGAPSGTGSLGRNRLRGVLVVSQMALALVLLSGAGLLIKTFLRETRPPEAVELSNVLLADLTFLAERYREPAQVREAVQGILERLEGGSRMQVSASRTEFLAGFGAQDQRIAAEGMAEVPPGASPRFALAVSPAYFAIRGIELTEGRPFAATDGPGAPSVVIVNENVARALWPDESALGRRVRLGPGEMFPWMTVVGVVRDIEEGASPRRRAGRFAYVPFAQRPGEPVQLHLRSSAGAAAVTTALRAAAREVDPDLPVEMVRSAEDDLERQYWPVRFFATFLASFAAFAVLLAAIGTYGVLAYLVSQRTREFGVRMAVGAARSDVIGLVVRQGAALGGLGLVLGIGGSALLTPVIRAMLFGTSPLDPTVMLAVAALFGAVMLVASYLPARRAAEVDPMVALRQE